MYRLYNVHIYVKLTLSENVSKQTNERQRCTFTSSSPVYIQEEKDDDEEVDEEADGEDVVPLRGGEHLQQDSLRVNAQKIYTIILRTLQVRLKKLHLMINVIFHEIILLSVNPILRN